MAAVRAEDLRTLARETMLACGARGFMRFDERGDALLVTDAAARCADGGEALVRALTEAGFSCRRDGALIALTPGGALLERLCEGDGGHGVIWDDASYPALSLAQRLLREARRPLTPDGEALVLLAARLCCRAGEGDALMPLRAELARRLRRGDRNGFYQTGRLLANRYGIKEERQ